MKLFRFTAATKRDEILNAINVTHIELRAGDDHGILQDLIDKNAETLIHVDIGLSYICHRSLSLGEDVSLRINSDGYNSEHVHTGIFTNIKCEYIEFYGLTSPNVIEWLKRLPKTINFYGASDDVIKNFYVRNETGEGKEIKILNEPINADTLPSLGLLKKRYPLALFSIRYNGVLPRNFLIDGARIPYLSVPDAECDDIINPNVAPIYDRINISDRLKAFYRRSQDPENKHHINSIVQLLYNRPHGYKLYRNLPDLTLPASVATDPYITLPGVPLRHMRLMDLDNRVAFDVIMETLLMRNYRINRNRKYGIPTLPTELLRVLKQMLYG